MIGQTRALVRREQTRHGPWPVARMLLSLAVLAAGCAPAQQAARPTPPSPSPTAAPTPAPPSPAPATTPIPTAPPTSSPGAEIQAGGALTPDEQRDALDRRLGASLSSFDEMLLKEQKEVAAKRAEQAATGGSGTGSGGEGESGGGTGGPGARSGGGGKGEKGGETSGQTATGDRATGSPRGGGSSRRGGRTTATAPEGTPPTQGGSIPKDVGDGRDDDVVARQIREAAMKEQDPAIREKLWEEYRRYKGIRKGES